MPFLCSEQSTKWFYSSIRNCITYANEANISYSGSICSVNTTRLITSASESKLPLPDAVPPLIDERVIGADGIGFLETARRYTV